MPAPSARRAPRIFISYSHDSEEHRAAVLELAQQLRGAGLDVQLDRYVTSPPEGWPRWMMTQVEEADFVLVVCTPTYRRRFDGKERRGKGLGAAFEGLLALQLFYEAGAKNKKFVPVLLPGAAVSRAVPLALRPFTPFRAPAQLDELVAHLHGRAAVEPAPLVAATAGRRPTVRSDGAHDALIGREEFLEKLLLSLFTDVALRRWIARDPECQVIANKLPGAGASPEDLGGAAIDAMTRQGLVDAGLFDRLLGKFPRRDADVRRVAAVWGVALSAAPGTAAASPVTGRNTAASKRTSETATKKRASKKASSGTSDPAATPASIVLDAGIIMGTGARIGGHAAGRDLVIHQTADPKKTAKKPRDPG